VGEGADERARAVSDWRKKKKGERSMWAAAANGPEERAGPCGDHGPHAGEASGELGCGLEERRGERGLGFGVFS
jgi:hypothetical protein